MPRPPTEKKNAREVAGGMTVRWPGGGKDVEVGSVSVVLHMTNGMDLTFNEKEEVSVVVEPQVDRTPK